MPNFICRLAAEDGRVISEAFLSPSADECRRHFESEGYCVLSVKKDWKSLNLASLSIEKKVKDRDFIMFNQEFMALIRAGYPVLRSLEVISNRTKNARLKEILRKVENEIRQGKTISEAFTPFEKHFTKVYTAALMAGEQSGNLPDTIGQFNQYAKVIAQTKARIRSALIYPTLLLSFSVSLVIILINFVLPNFAGFYQDFDSQLPFITTLVVGFSLFVRRTMLLWVLLLVLLVGVVVRMKKIEKTNILLDKFKLKIPLFKGIWLESAVSLFSRTLGLLIRAGVSLVPSVSLASQAIPNKFLASKTAVIPVSIKNGESLSESIANSEFFPPLALDMVRIGETSANLGGMLKELADVFDERIQSKIDTFVSLIEPIMIIFMGGLVALMLLSVYLPIFNIIKVAR